jgi:hypothetical protein
MTERLSTTTGAPDMRVPRRSREPAGHCLLSDVSRRGEREHYARDLKHTHSGHLSPYGDSLL